MQKLADRVVRARARLVVVEVFERLFQLVLDLVHALLETLDTLAQATHEFRNLLAAEEQQYNRHNQDNLACSQV